MPSPQPLKTNPRDIEANRKRFDEMQIKNKGKQVPSPEMPAFSSSKERQQQNLPPLKGNAGARNVPVSDPIFLN